MYQKPLPTLMTAILPRPSVRLAQTVQCRFTGEPLHTTETLIEREMHSSSCDTRTTKNKAANMFVCIHQIQTANQVQQNRSRRRKLCGRSLSPTCESKPCDYFQICATRTSRATALILRSTIT